jgi:hypothetical protein
MTSIRAPKTTAQATALLDRYAELEGQRATLEARRSRMIARANAAVDAKVAPLIAGLALIAEKVEPWWQKAGQKLLAPKAKSMQLGGCKIGTRTSRPTLVHTLVNDAAAVAVLQGTRYKKQTVRVTYSVDRVATLKLLQQEGKPAQELTELGFSVDQGEQFFLERVQQTGTIGS